MGGWMDEWMDGWRDLNTDSHPLGLIKTEQLRESETFQNCSTPEADELAELCPPERSSQSVQLIQSLSVFSTPLPPFHFIAELGATGSY